MRFSIPRSQLPNRFYAPVVVWTTNSRIVFSVSDALGRTLRLWNVEASYTHLTVRSIKPSRLGGVESEQVRVFRRMGSKEVDEEREATAAYLRIKRIQQQLTLSLLKYVSTPGGEKADPVHLLTGGGGVGGGAGANHAQFFGHDHQCRTKIDSAVGSRIFHAFSARRAVRVMMANGTSERPDETVPTDDELQAFQHYDVRQSDHGVVKKAVAVGGVDELKKCHVVDRGCIYKLPMAVNEERVFMAGTIDTDALLPEQWPLTLEVHSASAQAISQKQWSTGMYYKAEDDPVLFVYLQTLFKAYPEEEG
jgi:hypothetical protein